MLERVRRGIEGPVSGVRKGAAAAGLTSPRGQSNVAGGDGCLGGRETTRQREREIGQRVLVTTRGTVLAQQ